MKAEAVEVVPGVQVIEGRSSPLLDHLDHLDYLDYLGNVKQKIR